MRIDDLDRDHSHIFPSEATIDSRHMYARMASVAFELLRTAPGFRLVDVAAGLGNDADELATRGVRTTCVEPSKLLTQLGDMVRKGPRPAEVTRARAWGERLPFADGAFDGALCKGSLDHFDDPVACIGELARVTRPGGRVVLVVANMESLGLRWVRAVGRWRGRRLQLPGRRHEDVPADHLTRYDADLLRAHVAEHLIVEQCVGVSLFWGNPRWVRLLRRLSPRRAGQLLGWTDRVARSRPGWADVIVVAGRRRASTAA